MERGDRVEDFELPDQTGIVQSVLEVISSKFDTRRHADEALEVPRLRPSA